jgi:hypothetical protein
MARPTSFRLPEGLLVRLEDEGRSTGTSVTALVTTLLDEGLKTRRFPGVTYRDGAAGRRAALVGGPDVWEIVRDLHHTPGRGARKIGALAAQLGLTADRVRLAADFYSEFPEEIDQLIELDEAAARRVRTLTDRRERLLSR